MASGRYSASLFANPFIFRSVVVGSLGGLLFGYDTAIISGATHSLVSVFSLTPGRLGFTVSSALWGTVIGAMCSGIAGARWGVKKTLLIMALLYLISALGCGLAWDWTALISFRFIGGIGIGGSSVVGPVYISEISAPEYRGRLVGLFQINIVVGILIAYLSIFLFGSLSLGMHEWRWELGIAAIPAALFAVSLSSVPESPRWLIMRDRFQEARAILQRLRGTVSSEEYREILLLTPSKKADVEPVFQAKYRLPLFIAITMGIFNQLSGINAILYYLNDIFRLAGFSRISGDFQAVAVGIMNFVATVCGMILIDRVGRKPLLMIGAAGTGICLAGIAFVFSTHRYSHLLVFMLLGFIAFFAVSQGSVIWVFIGEVFPNAVRAKGQSIGCSSHWIMNAIISGVFPLLAAHSGAYPFMVFAFATAIQLLTVIFIYPETKRMSLEQLQMQFGIAD